MSVSSSRTLLITSLALWPATAIAHGGTACDNDVATPGASQVPVITVVGHGLEDRAAGPVYAARTIAREDIVAAPSGRIEEVLGGIAGFQQFRRSDSRSSNPSAQGVTLRSLGGNATSRALVLLDGVPMADPFFGFIPFPALAPERLDSIRITRGGGSGPFGAGALAGIIELTSQTGTGSDPVSAQFLVNDRGDTEVSAALSSSLGSGFASLSGRWDRGPGFFTNPEAERNEQTARARFDSYSLQARGVAPLTNTIEIQARGLIYDDRRTLRFDGADSSSAGQDASVRMIGRGKWAFDVLGYVQSRNFTNTVISSTRFVPVLDQRNTPSTGLGGKIEIRPPTGERKTLRLGLDYRRSEGRLYETAISAFSGNVTERRTAGGANSDLGLFAESDVVLGSLLLTGGLRADRFAIEDGFFAARSADDAILREKSYADRMGWTGSYRSGLAFSASERVRLRAAAYSGLRLPTLNELYRPFVIFPVTTNANAALRNEFMRGYEGGIDLSFGPDLEVALTAFDNTVTNAIANVTLDERTRQRRNIDRILVQGLEASARYASGPWRFDGSLALTDAVVRQDRTDIDGNRPAQTPKFAGAASVTYRLGMKGRVSVNLRHLSRQYEDDLESDALPAATTLGFYAKVPLGRDMAILFRGENLTDERIVTRNQGGSLDYGAPRTFWLGLSAGM